MKDYDDVVYDTSFIYHDDEAKSIAMSMAAAASLVNLVI